MSSELFDKNLSRLLRHAALPDEEARRARAREKFLRAAETSPAGRTRGLAVAAAALLVCTVVYAATRPTSIPALNPSVSRPAQDGGPAFRDVPAADEPGHGSIRGVLKMAKGNGGARAFLFQGRSKFPEGTCFQVSIKVVEQRFLSGRLLEEWTDPRSFTPVLKDGAFECSWEASKTGRLGIRITTPDVAQDMAVADQLKHLAEDDRSASFDYYPWDDALLAKLEPQLAELSDLAREVRDLIDRVEASCATEETFKSLQKALIAEARRLESRAKGFTAAGLFAAGAGQIALTAGDLAGAMAIFTWKGREFQGPTSYYTNHQRGKTFRGDPFEFAALRRYLDEAVQIGGREFDLWIVQDFFRARLRPALVETVNRSSRRPGVAEFADRLKSEPTPALVEEIRRLSR